jgi:hypothetical protein
MPATTATVVDEIILALNSGYVPSAQIALGVTSLPMGSSLPGPTPSEELPGGFPGANHDPFGAFTVGRRHTSENHPAFLEHCDRRSHVECTFSAVKRKLTSPADGSSRSSVDSRPPRVH